MATSDIHNRLAQTRDWSRGNPPLRLVHMRNNFRFPGNHSRAGYDLHQPKTWRSALLSCIDTNSRADPPYSLPRLMRDHASEGIWPAPRLLRDERADDWRRHMEKCPAIDGKSIRTANCSRNHSRD